MIITLKKVHRRNQYGEYCINEYHNGTKVDECTYFTDDRQDLDNTFLCIIDNYTRFSNYKVVAKEKKACVEIVILAKGGIR